MSGAWIALGIIAAIGIAIAAFFQYNLRGRPERLALSAGDTLPAFTAEDETGASVSSSELRGRPVVMLFIRGNWCPFCARQVADLTKHYKAITELGARLIFVTPKPLDTTRRVAEMFGVEFDFWLDRDLRVARELGLVHKAGVPGKHQGTHGTDTVWPTAIVCDADGRIVYASQSRRILDRPDPAVFVEELRQLA